MLPSGEAWRRFEFCAWLLVWLYVAIVVLAILGQPIDQFDEAIPLVAGREVQQGQTPHVDFFSTYPPLYYYLTAAALDVFGQTILVHRSLKALLYIVFLIVATRFLLNEFPDFRRLIPCTVLLAAVAIGPNIAIQAWVATALSWLALLTYLLGWRAPPGRRRWMFALSGLLAGIALMTRVNFGLYVSAVIGCDLVLGWIWKEKSDAQRSSQSGIVQALIHFTIPFLLSNVIFYACVYGRNTGLVFAQSVLGVQTLMSKHRFIELDFSTASAFAFAVPMLWFSIRLLRGTSRFSARTLIPAGLGCTLAGAAFVFGKQSSIALYIPALEIALLVWLYAFVLRVARSEVCLLLFYACLLHYYLSRADDFHMAPLLLAGAMLLPFLLFSPQVEGERERLISPGSALIAIVAAICILLTAAGLKPNLKDVAIGARILASGPFSRSLSDGDRILNSAPGGPWVALADQPGELQALRFIRFKTSRTDPIFVGVADHSKAFANDVLAYWLADRPAGVRYTEFEPGIVTEAPAQREMISDLERHKVRYAVIETSEYVGDETFQKSAHAGSRLLDEYLEANFREMAQFGDFSVLERAH